MTKAFEIGFGKTNKEVSLENLKVRGEVPKWLKGDLIRNGPGTFKVGEQQYNHWFDGLAMLHRFSFENGQVSYQNKFLECKAYSEAMETGKIAYSEFATDPCFGIFDRIKAIFNSPMTDSAKVSIAQIGEKVMALSETPMQMQFDPKTLQSLGVFNYDAKPGMHVTTVHPHYDHHKNKNYNITTRFGRVSKYRVLEIGESQKPKLICSMPTKEVGYMHSFGMSPNYFTLTEFPILVNPLAILFSGKPFVENFKWKAERGTVFHVVDRIQQKRVAKIKTEAFFAFHHVNSFEEQGFVYVDIVGYKDASVIKDFYLNKIKADDSLLPVGEFRRYKVDPFNGKVEYKVIGDELLELPRFDYERFNMDGAYRYVYGVGVNQKKPQSFYNQLVKIDLKTGESRTWYQDGAYPGEAVFIGKPERTEEDDGVLLSVVLDESSGTSYLLILDAANLSEIARAEVPHPILFGYHGEYFGS